MANLIQALGQTADWFRRALAVEPVKGNLRLSGYSACGQDGGVQLPRQYVEGINLCNKSLCLLFGHPNLVVGALMAHFFSVMVKMVTFLICLISLFPDGVTDADLVLLVTTRPTTGNTLAWAVACERDQWGRAIAGNLHGAMLFLIHQTLPCVRSLNSKLLTALFHMQDMLMLLLAT